MSKAIYACSRRESFDSNDEEKLINICNRLEPDNIESDVDHRISVNERVCYGIMNYQPTISIDEDSLLLGYLYEERENWNETLTGFPDGSYALFRTDENHLEVIADVAGTRTIWYYFDDELFLASTSQRAIIMFLGDFIFDSRVIPWMLSTGSLGPKYSWDERLERIPPDSSVVLNRQDWSLSSKKNPIEFPGKERSKEEHKKLLKDAIEETIDSLKDLNLDKWALPLSGGYDSRAILCFMDQKKNINEEIQTVTWGLQESLEEKENDAYLAREVAKELGVPHKYYPTDLSEESVEKIFDRFLYFGEGRTDHFSGYADGMRIWSDLFEENFTGIIRGDVGFSTLPESPPPLIRLEYECRLCSDYSNLKDLVDIYNLPDQNLPSEFKPKEDESLSKWRDRFYQTYRLPIVIAALSDLKYSYVEQINPMLSKAILKVWRELPDNLREDKVLFKEVVNSVGPKIPHATKGANASLKEILREKEITEMFVDELTSEYSEKIFDSEFIEHILNKIQKKIVPSDKSTLSLRQKLKKLIPKYLEDYLFKNIIFKSRVLSNFYYSIAPPNLDWYKLAFRVFIIIRMYEILEEDSKVVKK